MSSKEQQVIQQFNELFQAGLITLYEYNWCVGAIRNRKELTRETRHQLRDTVHEIIKQARARSNVDKE